MLSKIFGKQKTESKTSTMGKFSLIAILVCSIGTAVIASVAIPAYNSYIRGTKEKIALNLAALVAQSASAYYSQNETAPSIGELNIYSPSGYIAVLQGTTVQVSGDGCQGYTAADFDAQSVTWR